MLASTQGLDDVARAFAAKIQELQELTLLRVDNGSKDISSRELAALDTSVQAIEQKLRDIQHFIDTANVEAQPAAAKQTAGDKKKRAKAPRRYISQAELASVSGYMRGRLTIETVNSAIDDAASHSEANAKLMAATKSNSVKPADRKRATTLLHCVTGKEGIRGRYWFLESDLKGGTTLKMDKTGKAILTVLRHLGRLTEVRVSLDGTPQVAHVLQPE
ncbi:hypothetical protein WJX79_001095 [Trebouxia sp. C0005]